MSKKYPYSFGHRSTEMLSTAHILLRGVAHRALELTACDFAIVQGHRDKDGQDIALSTGKTQLEWPNSKHNSLPSIALDFCAYPDPYNPHPKMMARYYLIAGAWYAAAKEFDLELRWGGDWDGDGDMMDQTFDDLGHVEIVFNPLVAE